MKNKFLGVLIGSVLLVSVLGGFSACGTSDEGSAGSASSAASSTAATSETQASENALADTSWTADVGEEYGAAVQGDEDEGPLTTLTLYFTDDGRAFNAVGDISFDYKLDADGTVEVSNLDLGDTDINGDVFDLTYKDGKLTLNTRIAGGNATLNFEKEQ